MYPNDLSSRTSMVRATGESSTTNTWLPAITGAAASGVGDSGGAKGTREEAFTSSASASPRDASPALMSAGTPGVGLSGEPTDFASGHWGTVAVDDNEVLLLFRW